MIKNHECEFNEAIMAVIQKKTTWHYMVDVPL